MSLADYINSELQKRLDSESGKKEVSNLIKKAIQKGGRISLNVLGVDEAIQVLKQCICNFAPPAFSSPETLASISEMIDGSISDPIPTADGWIIKINFNQEKLVRPSLWKGSSGAYDIVGLFSQGWEISEEKKVPVGTWHGHKTVALRSRPGRPFVEEAVNFFMTTYADKYGITGIDINPLYGEWGI